MAESTKQYSYYDDLLNNLSGDLDDVSIQKIQNTGDYLEQKSDYDNNLFDPSTYYDALLEKNTEHKTPKEDKDLYGFIPGDWLPDWVKAGYNQSHRLRSSLTARAARYGGGHQWGSAATASKIPAHL